MNQNNFIPPNVKKIYLMAICGTGMGSLAGLLKKKGYEVSGSDDNVYPPMSHELSSQNIPVFSPYSPDHLKKVKPDLVIVGNAISKTNPEADELLRTNLPYVSMPQALKHFFLSSKEVIVVSGTHGKTTTTSIMAYLLSQLGADPSFLIGGVSKNFSSNIKIGSGKYFVIEGDEYDTAFFDKGPKFLHYNPRHVIMTSLEFDHADVYRDLEHITESFIKLVQSIPRDGSLHYCSSYSQFHQVVSSKSVYFVRKYGTSSREWTLKNFESNLTGSQFDLCKNGKRILEIRSPLTGIYNAENVIACFSVLDHLGFDLNQAAEALQTFSGVKRRQEILFQNDDFILIDDFAHHPTAVQQTIRGIRQKYPNAHLLAVFEPRSNTSRRNIFQAEYTESLSEADEIILAKVNHPEKVKDGAVLDVKKIIEQLRKKGKTAHQPDSTSEIVQTILKSQNKPAVIIVMSNGSFDNLCEKLVRSLKS